MRSYNDNITLTRRGSVVIVVDRRVGLVLFLSLHLPAAKRSSYTRAVTVATKNTLINASQTTPNVGFVVCFLHLECIFERL